MTTAEEGIKRKLSKIRAEIITEAEAEAKNPVYAAAKKRLFALIQKKFPVFKTFNYSSFQHHNKKFFVELLLNNGKEKTKTK